MLGLSIVVVVDRVEGHGRSTGKKTEKLVSSSFYGCKEPSITVLKRRYKVTEWFSHYGSGNPYPPDPGRTAPIPLHKHISYKTRYENVKRSHSEYRSSCDTEECGWKEYRDKKLGTCPDGVAGFDCNRIYRALNNWCQENDTSNGTEHWSCKDIWECKTIP